MESGNEKGRRALVFATCNVVCRIRICELKNPYPTLLRVLLLADFQRVVSSHARWGECLGVNPAQACCLKLFLRS